MLSPLAQALRRHDPDRFLTLLFAPEERREALVVLYAFNYELARARVVTSQSLLALIRLQWWREVVEGEDKPGEIATPLSALLRAGQVSAATLEGIVAAYEQEVDGAFPDQASWSAWLMQGAGGLAVAAGEALGVEAPAVLAGLRLRGAAYGAAGLFRARFAQAGQGLLPSWPEDLLAAEGLSREAALAEPRHPGLLRILHRLRAEARGWLTEARRAPPPPRSAIAAALPGVLAARDLAGRRDRPQGPRGFADRFAVTWRGIAGGA
ncbi:squalene/phytoene synthase family protein [Acidisoma sp. C75]